MCPLVFLNPIIIFYVDSNKYLLSTANVAEKIKSSAEIQRE